MFYCVYKITNKINSKFYIGMHQTIDINDGYMGSGKRLHSAYKKYGIENFEKEILHIFDNEKDMRNKEKELVVISEMSYNLCEGGKGGFGYINRNGLGIIHKFTSEESSRGMKGKKLSEQRKETIKQQMLGKQNFLGKNHTNETKQKISEANKGKIPWNKGKTYKHN